MTSYHVKMSFNDDEIQAIRDAADDCHLSVTEYCRLMTLCAAGMGGVLEHAERVVRASFDADKRPGFTVRVSPKRKKRAK